MASGRAVRLVAAESRSWASATFDGARHRLELTGPAAAVELMLAGLEEREFDMKEHVVADIVVTGCERMDALVTVMVEALTVGAA